MAALTGGIAMSVLIALYVALGAGPASTVTAISASYPIVTVLLASIFLSEHLNALRVGGVALVIVGVVIVTFS